MVLGAILAALSVIAGYTIAGIQGGLSILQTFFQMLPDKLKHIVLGAIMVSGGVFWIEICNALSFKLYFFGIDLTLVPLAVAIGLAFLAVLNEIFEWYNFWK